MYVDSTSVFFDLEPQHELEHYAYVNPLELQMTSLNGKFNLPEQLNFR